MNDIVLTGHDLRHASETIADMLQDDEHDGGPETVMLSIGYAEVWPDGDIVSFGVTLYTVDPDSAGMHCPVCGHHEERDHGDCEERVFPCTETVQ